MFGTRQPSVLLDHHASGDTIDTGWGGGTGSSFKASARSEQAFEWSGREWPLIGRVRSIAHTEFDQVGAKG